jgi:hypothetical protein
VTPRAGASVGLGLGALEMLRRLMLGQGLCDAGARREAQGLLRLAQAPHPGDLWIDSFLGWQLAQDKGQEAEALRFLTAAAALKPDNLSRNFGCATADGDNSLRKNPLLAAR